MIAALAVWTLLAPFPKPVKTPPLAYFTDHCARCHGPNGSNYGDELGKSGDLKQLRQSIIEMCEGPGQAPLDQPDIDVQFAFHRALIDKTPFAVWTATKDGVLTGELLPNTKLVATVGAKPVAVTVKDGLWSLKLPAGAQMSQLSLTASSGSKKLVWKPLTSAFIVAPIKR